MSIASEVPVIEHQLWVQGDIRDPLGIWVARLGVTGDASGGEIKVGIIVPAERRSAFIYTCYAVTPAQLTGAVPSAQNVGCRLLTNWPDADLSTGVQGFATFRQAKIFGDATFTAPLAGGAQEGELIQPNDRFILLFDPRPDAVNNMTIVEMKWGENVDLATYSFEGYGYYWDRSVLNAPGGLRHPGSA